MNLPLVSISCYLLIFLFPLSALSQKLKFKPPTKKEMNITQCDFYPEAKAIILDKKGQLYFDVSATSGVVYHYHEAQRILILDEEAKEEANVRIVFYSPKSNNSLKEKIYNISGTTYNLTNGSIEKTELEKANIHQNRLTDDLMEVTFAMPNVKVGSLIEYYYSKESEYLFDMDPWYFQMDYPVINNEFQTIIPEYFDFQERITGNLFKMNRQEKLSSALLGGVSTNAKAIYYKAENIPPIEDEPFVSNKCDLPMRLNYYIVALRFPHQPVQYIAGTIQNLNTTLLETDSFWRAAMHGNFPNEVMKEANEWTGKEKAEFLFNWIKENIAWNGSYGIFRYGTVRECLREKKGNVADINLSLNALFRENGLEAYPVILSSRGNGVVHPVFTNISDFNYVISAVKIGEEVYLCDATAHTYMGLLPPRCLNYSGYMITESGAESINLTSVGKNIAVTMCKFFFDGNKIIADISSQENEYGAYTTIENYYAKGETNYTEEFASKFPDWKFKDYEFTERETSIIEKFKLETEHSFEDILYFQPFIYGISKESPFKRDTRLSMIEYPYGFMHRVTILMDLPEGYELEELPERVNLMMRDKAANFMLVSGMEDRTLTLSFTFNLSRLTYSPQEYPDLKAFFDKIAEIANTTLVLKKKA